MRSMTFALALGAAALAGTAFAQPTPLGAPFLVNASTTSLQDAPAIAADGADNFRVVWQSLSDATSWDVRTRRIQANGSLGADALLSQTSAGSQTAPDIDMTANGDWAAIWVSDQDPDTFTTPYHRVTTAGGTILQGEVPFEVPEDARADSPSIAAISDDLMVGAWRDELTTWGTLDANIRSRTGTDYGSTTYGEPYGFEGAHVAGLYFEEWAAVWTELDTNGSAVRLRCFEYEEPTGQIQIVSPDGAQSAPDVASNNYTRLAVVWTAGSAVHARVYVYDFLSGCEAVSEPFQVSPEGEYAGSARVGMAPDGGFVVGWRSTAIDADGGFKLREFTKEGVAVGPAVPGHDAAPGSQSLRGIDLSVTQLAVVYTTPDFGTNPPNNIAARRYERRVIFTDGFEFAYTSLWSDTVP